jgi:hypothetical protein
MGMRTIIGKLAPHTFWGAVLAAVLLYGLGQLDAASSDAVRDWRSAAGLARRAGGPYRDSIGRLLAIETAWRGAYATLQANYRARGRALDSLLATVDTAALPPVVRHILIEQGIALATCDSAVAALAQALEACRSRASLAEQRADTLEALVRRGLAVTRCRWLVVPCPSRAVTFGLGTVVGALARGALR